MALTQRALTEAISRARPAGLILRLAGAFGSAWATFGAALPALIFAHPTWCAAANLARVAALKRRLPGAGAAKEAGQFGFESGDLLFDGDGAFELVDRQGADVDFIVGLWLPVFSEGSIVPPGEPRQAVVVHALPLWLVGGNAVGGDAAGNALRFIG